VEEDGGGGEWRFRSSYREEIRHFLECLRDGKEPMTSGRDNLKTMAAIEGMFLSSKEGRAVQVHDLLEE
jgi:predicted dehydrogenase